MSDNTPLEKQPAGIHPEYLSQESEQLLRVVWEFATDAMALSAADGTVLAANPAYFRLYGFAPEKVLGQHFAIIFPEEQRQTAYELYDYMFRSPAIGPAFVGPVRRADGSERFVESRYTFLLQGGQRVAMLSIVRDLTEQKRGEEAQWVSEEKLRMALEAGHLGSWDWDLSSGFIHWRDHLNAPVVSVGGEQGMSYDTFLQLVHPADRTQVEQALGGALSGEAEFAVAFRATLGEDDPRWKRIQGQVLHDEAGKPVRVIGVSRDVPGNRQTEEEAG